MTQRHAVMAASALGLSVAFALGSTAVAGNAAPVTPAAGTATHALTVKDVQFLGSLDQNEHVANRDGGESVEYQGKSYWFFSDSILQNPAGFVSSTTAVTTDLDASDGISLEAPSLFDAKDTSAVPPQFVPATASETSFTNAHAASDCTNSTDEYCGTQFAYWPGAVVADPAQHRILAFYIKLCRGGLDSGPCATGFVGQEIGTGIISVDMNTHKVSRLAIENQDPSLTSPEGADPTLQFTAAENWGYWGAVTVGQELYTYGDCDDSHNCGVARVPLGQVQDRAAWTFYTGGANGQPVWSHDPDSATIVMTGGAAGQTVQYDPVTKQYMDTYMPFLSDQALFETAPHPWGPWSTPQLLFNTPTSTGSSEYAAFAHPEYTTNHGLTRYFTYYTSATGEERLVRVDFTKN